MSPRSLDYKAFLELHKILPAQSTSPLPNPLPSQLPSQPAAPIRRPSNGTDSTVDTSTRMRPRAATPRFKPFTPPRPLLLHARSDGLAPIRPAAGRTDPTRRMKHVNLSDPASAPVRWHADLKQRVGKCIMFGCDASQISKAAGVTRALGGEWRTLMAGAEGFLTGNGEGEYWAKGRRGLEAREVVWGEMDSFQHVNNTNYIRYAESARVNWITYFANIDVAHATEWKELMTPKATGLILKSIKTDFKLPVTYPDRVSVYHKLRHAPTAIDTSIILDCIILSHKHQRVAARTEEDIVLYDYQKGKKTTMPPFVLDAFKETWRLQEEETRRAQLRIWQLCDEVRALEKETWDLLGRVEDMGTA